MFSTAASPVCTSLWFSAHHALSSSVPSLWTNLPSDIFFVDVITSPLRGPAGIVRSSDLTIVRTGASNSSSYSPPPSAARRCFFCLIVLVVKLGVHPWSTMRLNNLIPPIRILACKGTIKRMVSCPPKRWSKEYFGVCRPGVPSLIYRLTIFRAWRESSSSSSFSPSSLSTLRLKLETIVWKSIYRSPLNK